MSNEIILQTETKMKKCIDSLNHQFSQISTGRANSSMLDRVSFDYYGSPTPINQMAAISVTEGRTLVIKAYDKSVLPNIEKAIFEANLGLTPQNDGEVIRISIAPLTEDKRKLFAKDAAKMAEDAKVAIRNVRRDGNDELKKNKDVSEDETKSYQNQIQTLTDKYIKLVEASLKEKEAEIMSV